MLWLLSRGFFLWLPYPLFLLVNVVFIVFVVLFIAKVVKLVWDILPFV